MARSISATSVLALIGRFRAKPKGRLWGRSRPERTENGRELLLEITKGGD
jgi:hypothetical protein